ncbi:MAG: amidase [Acidobacteria bacterium]|nr:amidase [Acidobacteriota bacterium]
MTNRREFLKTGVAGFAALAFFRNVKGDIVTAFDDDPYPQLVETTIPELQALMKAKKLTSRKLCEMYLERIKVIDPKTHAVLELNPDALSIADQMDKERKKGKVRSPMHGIPILIKDNIDTADKMHTTAGSWALYDAPTPKQDAHVAAQLRKSGAVILGKANLTEWANFRSTGTRTRQTSGWSGRGGQTNNPYWLDQNPLGSSSGSAVSVSANLIPVAIGTETSGSIISPAVVNGVVGIKPTVGLVSRAGIIPISHSQDTAGPLTRTVTDAAIVLTAIAGSDPRDPATLDADKKRAKDYTKFLDKNALKGARLGLVNTLPQRPAILAAYNAFWEPLFQKMRDAGATLVDVKFPDFGKDAADGTAILKYEFKADLNKYLGERGGQYKTLADLIKFNEENKDKEMPFFGQELFTQSQAMGDLTDPAYLDTLAKRRKQTRDLGIDALLTQNRLDALVGPYGVMVGIAAGAGYPSLTVPVGIRDIPAAPASGNIPASSASKALGGLMFVGTAWDEPKIIRYGYAFEQLTKGRVTPQFIEKMPTS